MGIRVNATEAAALVDRTERRVREWIRQGKLRAEPAGPRAKGEHVGPTSWSIDVEDLALMPGVTINRDRLAELETGRSRSPGGVLARLEQLESRQRVLEARLRLVEQRTPIASGTSLGNSAPNLGTDSADSEYHSPPAFHYSAKDKQPFMRSSFSAGWPMSARGRARWVEEHGGPRASWVREWPGVMEWTGPEDAIAAVRARARGYEHWLPD